MTAGLLQDSDPSKAVLPSPTGPLSLQMPSFCIELARRPTHCNKCVAEQLERTSISTSESATKSSKRGTYENYTPKEKAETSCYAWYHSHNKASPCLAKLSSNHEIFNTKINNFANLKCFTKFLCLENLELYASSWHSIKALHETTWSGAQYAYFNLEAIFVTRVHYFVATNFVSPEPYRLVMQKQPTLDFFLVKRSKLFGPSESESELQQSSSTSETGPANSGDSATEYCSKGADFE